MKPKTRTKNRSAFRLLTFSPRGQTPKTLEQQIRLLQELRPAEADIIGRLIRDLLAEEGYGRDEAC